MADKSTIARPYARAAFEDGWFKTGDIATRCTSPPPWCRIRA
jgi:hypothetical protein